LTHVRYPAFCGLAISQANGCQGCLAAHIEFAKLEGLTDGEIAAARTFSSANPKAHEVLSFARVMLETRGHLLAAHVLRFAIAVSLNKKLSKSPPL
jgi:AhpD family alkylhydroperoxidase